MENGGTSRGGETREEILEHWETYDELYHELANAGYTTQRERVRNGVEPKRFPEALDDEIAIDVARDGELLFVDGSHRLCIAKLLDLDAIPVTCYYRHREWMDVRESIYGADSVDELDDTARRRLQANHPDLRDLDAPLDRRTENPR